MKKYLTLFLLLVSIQQVFAELLAKNAPERKQLIAMGYVFQEEKAGSVLSVAETNTTKVVVERRQNRLAVSRFFTRKSLSSEDEARLLKVLNGLNEQYFYQFVMLEESILVSIYDLGVYNPQTFATMIRNIEKVDMVFTDDLLKLVNE